LVLASRAWRFGDAWLGYRVDASGPSGGVVQVAAFRPRGVAGLAYWRLLWPVHPVVLRAMVRHRRTRVTRPEVGRRAGALRSRESHGRALFPPEP